MLNGIFVFLVLASILLAAVNGEMQALTQEHHEALMMLAEAQARAAKVSVAADGTVGRA